MSHEMENDEIEIDLLKLMKALWKKAWLIVLAAVVLGGAVFGYKTYTHIPSYQATITMYAGYTKTTDGNIAQNSLSEARSIVNTCSAVLNTRMTLDAVIDHAKLNMSSSALAGMVAFNTVNNTEIFTITVTAQDAEQTALIANAVGEVLPEKVAMVNDSSTIGIIDQALVPTAPMPNNIMKNAAVAAVLGAFLVCGVVVIKELVAEWKKNAAINKKTEQM